MLKIKASYQSGCCYVLNFLLTDRQANRMTDTLTLITIIFLVHWDKLQYPFSRARDGTSIKDIQDGTVIKNLMKPGGFLSVPEHLGLIINTDGVQTFNASKHSIWPIYLMVSNLPPDVRILERYLVLAGAWFGPKKPNDMSLVLQPIIDKIEKLQNGPGLLAQTPAGEKNVKAVLLAGVFDLPAKAAVLNTVQFNGHYGCTYCKNKGSHFNHRHIYPPTDSHQLRKETEMTPWALEAERLGKPVFGVKGSSILSGVINIPYGIPIDYMHAVLEGVVKTLLKCWFNQENHGRPYYLKPYISRIDQEMLTIKPPHELPRRPRSIESSLLYWKASEYRAFMLFYAIPILRKYLQAKYVYHLSLLVFSMNKLLSNSICTYDLPQVQTQLELFYDLIPELYGVGVCTANVHSIIHLTRFVRLWGPLWTTSTFPFENANGILKRQIHGTRNVLLQMTFMMKSREFFSLHAPDKSIDNIVVGKICRQDLSLRHSKVMGTTSSTVFYKAKLNGTIYHSRETETLDASRRSSVIRFSHNNNSLLW